MKTKDSVNTAPALIVPQAAVSRESVVLQHFPAASGFRPAVMDAAEVESAIQAASLAKNQRNCNYSDVQPA